jgi:phage protein U
MIGTLGNIVFETSSERLRTIDGMKRSGSARWATHDIMANKPVLEFLGPDVEQISFSMRLDVFLGINPTTELEVLREMRGTGEAAQLILNGRPITEHKWVIENLSENWERIDNQGRLLVATVEISLKEYVPPEVQRRWSLT